MEKKHILICGPRGVGKSTLIEKLVGECTVPVYGFFTRSTPRDQDGFHSIYIHPAAAVERIRCEGNHIGDCNSRQRTVNTEVFTNIGVPLLQADRGGILFMDELGFMEIGSLPFCEAVMQCLNGDIPVVAAVKERYDIEFLNQIRSHPNAVLYNITKENRDDLCRELSAIVRDWNAELLSQFPST